MPTQHILFGKPFTLYTLPRRFQFLLFFLLLTTTLIFFFADSAADVPAVAAVTEHLPDSLAHPKIPSLPAAINPFAPSAHKPPPIQANSSTGDATWFSDWRWRNPFSSSVTLDENRAVLPPLKRRPYIYTFYEPTPASKKSKAVKAAEERVIFQWRRAWWAQGFKPVVLGRAEAINNPLYKKVQMLKLEDAIEVELARWLAWGNMGSGILSNWLVFPMAGRDNDLLKFLRKGNYPQLTRYKDLKNGIFCGEKKAINEAIGTAISKPEDLKKTSSLADEVFNELFQVDTVSDGIAFYDTDRIRQDYKSIASNLFSAEPVKAAKGYRELGQLINAHLQTTWQSVFHKGVAVVKPLPKHMTVLVEESLQIAGNLTECPINPLPTACPPNQPNCKKCISSQPLLITTPPTFRNKTGLFNIGSVPHPFTTTALTHERDVLDPKFVRRLGIDGRDSWIKALTQDLLGQGVGASARTVRFKEAVAGEYGEWHSLWLTAEKSYHEDLDWIFGFDIPLNSTTSRGKSETPVPGPERRPLPSKMEGPVLTESELSLDRGRLKKVRETVGSRSRHQILIRDAVEAWNLGDTEAWRFARAFGARRKMERRKWEEAEKGFAGAEGQGRGWGRWIDKVVRRGD
ncbi:hypothetical protein EJ08DRAFT_631261 [Tothia fuscella]|uniref:Uncharacterized protein n=1 Tax=Tothia fuscella TaxID=1048955 RepID=A0A9P4NUQ2_9PEZI|nr:hypothetical protein EJ08DRAFT_631261 [Tothia fuscella]